jgi:hypothetical protein
MGWLRERGYGVVRHASQQGFRVLRVTHGDTAPLNAGDDPDPAPHNL